LHRLVNIIIFTLVVYISVPASAGIVLAPSPQDVSLKQLIPLSTWNKQFKITEGKDRGKVVPLTLHRDRGKEGRWNLVFGDYAGIVLRNDAAGGFTMERLDLFKSHSYVVYEPALAILTTDVAAGGAVRHQASFKMFDIETGRLKRAGPGDALGEASFAFAL
jgi:hypothetical protein